jgi:hypothetical protein
VKVTVASPADRATFEHGKANTARVSPSQVHDVSGVGEAAYTFLYLLGLFKGHTIVGIVLSKPGSKIRGLEAPLIALGQAAAGRV